MRKADLPRVQVANSFMGIAHMGVCAVKDATDDEILAVCNGENPAGTTGGWSQVIRESYDDPSGFWPAEKMRPVKCEDFADRLHIMVGC